jgi:Sugar transferases involved in lipopolysaccharide synthesis
MVNVRENYVGSLYFDDTRIKTKPVYTLLKRVFDAVVSAVALVMLIPLFAVVAVLIKLDSEGSVIFSQKRVGKNGNLFNVYKFRTMKVSAPHETATSDLSDPYAHITRVGRFLRKTSIDELPQLFNVLVGDMSLVGPRPLIMGESDVHKLRMREGVYDVRPGVTGWAQVNGRDCVPAEEKVYFDKEYVVRRSVLFDMIIFAKTVSVVVGGQGYVEGRKN